MNAKPSSTAVCLALCMSLALPSYALAEGSVSGTLKIIAGMSNPAPRKVAEALAGQFDEMHPELDVELEIVDPEAWKGQIRSVLSRNPPDLFNWRAADRIEPYVRDGLLEDVSDMYEKGELPGLEALKDALAIDGKQWGVPYTYHQWGLYYREDIFNRLGLEEPATFDQEIANCRKILASGRKCYAIGSKSPWAARGGWFDYLNMRTNGFDFHMRLARGEVEWTDPRVRETFANWRKLIDMGAYIDDHQAYGWKEALSFMVKGEAAACLLGNFIVPHLREAGMSDAQIDFYQFPKIGDLPAGEDAPADTFHIAAKAANKEAAREFLKFVASPEVQTRINGLDGLSQLPINANASVADDEFIRQGFEMLSNRAEGGIAQFFDRDFPAEIASIGMEGFQEFMIFPDNLEDILQRLEAARKRIQK